MSPVGVATSAASASTTGGGPIDAPAPPPAASESRQPRKIATSRCRIGPEGSSEYHSDVTEEGERGELVRGVERTFEVQVGALGGFELRPTRCFLWLGEERAD